MLTNIPLYSCSTFCVPTHLLMDHWIASSSDQCCREHWTWAPAFGSLEAVAQSAIAGSPTKSVYNTLRNFQTHFVFNQETFSPHSGNTCPGRTLSSHFLGQRAEIVQLLLPEASALQESLCGGHTGWGHRPRTQILPLLSWTGHPRHHPFLLRVTFHVCFLHSFSFSTTEVLWGWRYFLLQFSIISSNHRTVPVTQRVLQKEEKVPRLCVRLTESLTLWKDTYPCFVPSKQDQKVSVTSPRYHRW